MKTSMLLLGGGIAIAAVLWSRHSAAETPVGLGLVMTNQHSARPSNPRYTESTVRAAARSWLARTGGNVSVRVLGSFYGFYPRNIWPWIDIEMRKRFAARYIEIAKWTLLVPPR
jgi:hypothetical protein